VAESYMQASSAYSQYEHVAAARSAHPTFVLAFFLSC
jgi:hypothetical protein